MLFTNHINTKNCSVLVKFSCGFLILILAASALAFDFPWGAKNYRSIDECVNIVTRTAYHKSYVDDVCARLFDQTISTSEQTRKYLYCTLDKVPKTNTRKDARESLFTCAKRNPPKKSSIALSLADYYFPTDEQLDEVRRSQAQAQKNYDALRRELMRPPINCITHSAGVDCF